MVLGGEQVGPQYRKEQYSVLLDSNTSSVTTKFKSRYKLFQTIHAGKLNIKKFSMWN